MAPDPSVREADREKVKNLMGVLCTSYSPSKGELEDLEDAICLALASTRQAAEEGQRAVDAKIAYELPLNVDYCVEAIKRGSKDASDGFIYIGDMIAKAIRSGEGEKESSA